MVEQRLRHHDAERRRQPGSVILCLARALLMWLIIAATVVLFSEPRNPVTAMRPLLKPLNPASSRDKASSAKSGIPA